MHKIIKSNQTTKQGSKKIDLYNIFLILNKSAEALVILLETHKNLSFKKVGNRYISNEHQGIKVEPVKGDKSQYTIGNYSAGAIDIPKGQIGNLLKHLTSHLQGFDRVQEQIKILTTANLINESGSIAQIAYKNHSNKQSKSKGSTTQAKSSKVAKKPTFVPYSTPYGQKVLQHLQKKTGATLETLERYHVHATTSPNQIRYAYQVGDTIKAKNASRSVADGKYYTYLHSNDYVFGLEQLPSTGKFLIIASGEDDTICINHNLNQYGIFAVCGWSEKTALPNSVLNALKKRFKHIYILSDNDNEKVVKTSKEIAISGNLIWLDTSNAKAFFNLHQANDICDIFGYQRYPLTKDLLKDFVLHLIGSNTRIARYNDDPFSIAVDHCYKIHFNQYIGEETPNKFGVIPLEFIKHQITKNNRLIIQSLAGSGKSTLVKKLIHQAIKSEKESDRFGHITPNLIFFRSIGVERVVVLEPTTAINNQLSKDIKKAGLSVGQLDSTVSKHDIATALNSDVVFCCYDSFIKLGDLSKTAVIIDEYHQLVNDFSYRSKKSFNYIAETLENKLKQAKKTILLSATPNYLFTLPTTVHGAFGYKLLKGIPTTKNSIYITPYIYEGTQRDILGYITENRTSKGLTTVKYDNKTNLKAIADSLNRKGEKCDYFHSGSPKGERKENNKNYISIMNYGTLSEVLLWLLYTTLMEAGISIKEQIDLNALVDTNSWQKAIQLISRARYNKKTGTNKEHNVWLFRSKDALMKEMDVRSFEMLGLNMIQTKGGSYSDQLNVVDRLKKLLYKAKQLSKISNELEEDEPITYDTKTDDKSIKTLHAKDTNGIWKPCIFGILNTLYQQEQNAPYWLFLERIKRFDNRVKIEPIKNVKLTEHEDLEEIRANIIVDKELGEREFIDCLINDFNMTVEVVCYLAKKGSFKRFVRETLQTNTPIKNEVLQYLEKHPNAFAGNTPKAVVGNIAKLLYSSNQLSKQKAIDTVINNEQKQIELYLSLVNQHKRTTAFLVEHEKVAGFDTYNQYRYTMLNKEVQQLKRNIDANRRGEWLKSNTIQKIVNNANQKANKALGADVFNKATSRQAVALIKNIYHVDTRKKGTGKKLSLAYRIGEPLSSDFDTFFESKTTAT